jgi:hypothetical protein
MENEGAENSNTNRPNHRPSRQHGDIGMSTELEHVRGTINNDEYAVINRNILTSDVDKIFSKMYSQYVLFRNKYS